MAPFGWAWFQACGAAGVCGEGETLGEHSPAGWGWHGGICIQMLALTVYYASWPHVHILMFTFSAFHQSGWWLQGTGDHGHPM